MAYPFLEPISPLRFPQRGVDLLFETCRLNLPVPIGPMAQVGVSAVGTLAGTMAQQNAEILAGLCIVQLIRPGTPVCYGGIPHAFDMRTTQVIFGGPEQALMAVGLTELGKSYGLPVYINVGLTDSKLPDAQAGLEAGITLACGAMAGADIFGHFGICGADQGASLSDAGAPARDHPLRRTAPPRRRNQRREAGPGRDRGGHSRPAVSSAWSTPCGISAKELWFPQLLDRRYWEGWAAAGRQDMHARCRAMKDRILREHKPQPLDEDKLKAIDGLLEAAKRHLSP